MVRHPPSRWQRFVIVGLTLWGLITICPDLLRPFWHYGTLGFEADNNGLIDAVSPTIKATPRGCIQDGDWIAMSPTWHPSRDLLLIFAEDILGILFILVCARIVWQHSSPATWGFFLYGVWFNPGQFFGLYAE